MPVTHELMNNSPYAVEQQIQDAVRAEINFALAHSVVWGNGIADPLGFATSAGNSTAQFLLPGLGSLSKHVQHNERSEDAVSRLYRTSQSQAIWLHHQSGDFTVQTVRTFRTTRFPVNIQNGGILNEVIQTLLGKPLIESELVTPLGDAGDVFLIDPKAYVASSEPFVTTFLFTPTS